jgi:hypothetical protein
MSKPKTKMSRLNTTCTEAGIGRWHFSTGVFNWEWTGGVGFNLFYRTGDAGWTGCIYAKSLDEAVMFAHGWEMGYRLAKPPFSKKESAPKPEEPAPQPSPQGGNHVPR